MQLDDIEAGDVLVTVRGDIACVIEVKAVSANPIRFQMKVGKTYQAKPDFFASKLGTFAVDALTAAADNPDSGIVQRREQRGSPFLPPALREMGIKDGDEISVRHGGSIKRAVFVGYFPKRPKYPISYTLDGKKWKGQESCIIGKAVVSGQEGAL